MSNNINEILSDDERLDLWVELCLLAKTLDELTDWWWQLDPGLSAANNRRAGISRAASDSENPE